MKTEPNINPAELAAPACSAYCTFCHADPHTLRDCPASGERRAMEAALIRAHDALRRIRDDNECYRDDAETIAAAALKMPNVKVSHADKPQQ